MIILINRLKNLVVFLGLLTGLTLTIIAGGYIWRGVFAVQVAVIGVCGVSGIVYFYWRGIIRKAQLPVLGIEMGVAAFVVALVASWIFSSDPRQGMDRLFLLLGYIILLYILADAFSAGLNKQVVVAALLVSSGILLALSGMEVYLRYLDWFKAVGSFKEWPPSTYRFVGFLGHPNPMMTYVNLIAPLCVVVIIKTKSIWARGGAILWLAFFLIAIPFSSARASWLGTLAWAASLLALWLLEEGLWRKLLRWAEKHKVQIGLILFLGILIAGVSGVTFYQFFGAHASHGNATFSGRFQIWTSALRISYLYPWFGSGPGRFPFEALLVDPTIPPAYWPSQGHSLLFNTLAELGLVGVVCGLCMMIWAGRQIWINYRHISEADRPWSRATLAALAGCLVQMVFDDHTVSPVVMVPFIIMAAWLLSTRKPNDGTHDRIGLNILAVPLGVILLVSGYMLCIYQRFSTGLTYLRQGNITTAIPWMEASLRDGNLSYYHSQTALVYAQRWGEKKDIEALAKARQMLRESLKIEPSPSLLWADLAVLDWYAGERVTAVTHITRAMDQSPLEPSYVLNYAWFMEESGRSEQAREAYQKVLTLRPEWVNHPFWQQTSFRQGVIQSWQQTWDGDMEVNNAYSQKAIQSATLGKYSESRRSLAFAQWLGEPEIAIRLAENHLALESGSQQGLLTSYATIEQLAISQRLITTNSFASAYSTWVNGKEGVDFDLVPGYLQLQPDFGQFKTWQQWIDDLVEQGNCDGAVKSARLLQLAIHGGSLVWEEPGIVCQERGNEK
jgi:tetratricopeptide (TPR) repeat protein